MLRSILGLGHIFIIVLLYVSFVLHFLNPPSYTCLKKVIKQPIEPIAKKVEPVIEKKTEVKIEEKTPKFIIEICDKPKDFLALSLKESLKKLEVKLGASVFIRIFKKEAILEVWIEKEGIYEHLKDYHICAYSGHLGPKLKEGDRQAPEGFYKVGRKALNPNSKFHLSFNLGYPNAYDKSHKRTGSFLMVHGNCVSIGCYAMTNDKIEEIYSLVEEALKKGQKFVQVHAYPFAMTKENMARHQRNKWYDFWVNLKEGYDYFESQKIPPIIKVEKKRYEIYE